MYGQRQLDLAQQRAGGWDDVHGAAEHTVVRGKLGHALGQHDGGRGQLGGGQDVPGLHDADRLEVRVTLSGG